MDAGNAQAHPIHRPFYKLGIASLALTTAFTFGSAAFNQTSAQDTSTKVVTAQTAKSEKQLPPELAKLPKVSLAEMQRLDSASVTFRPKGYTQKLDKLKDFVTVINANYSDGTNGIAVTAGLCSEGKCHVGTLPDKYVIVASKGEILSIIDLRPLADLYKSATGTELQYVRLVADRGTDADGQWLSVTVVPVEAPEAQIRSNIPAYNITCVQKEEGVSGTRLLIASL